MAKRFGVYAWNDCGCYPTDGAVRVFKLEHAAKREAEKLTTAVRMADEWNAANHRGYVVRSFSVGEDNKPTMALAY
jgi:hypothetical protein